MLSDYSLVISEETELNKAQFHLSGEFAARDGDRGERRRGKKGEMIVISRSEGSRRRNQLARKLS